LKYENAISAEQRLRSQVLLSSLGFKMTTFQSFLAFIISQITLFVHRVEASFSMGESPSLRQRCSEARAEKTGNFRKIN
jgi:hypothetical protein